MPENYWDRPESLTSQVASHPIRAFSNHLHTSTSVLKFKSKQHNVVRKDLRKLALLHLRFFFENKIGQRLRAGSQIQPAMQKGAQHQTGLWAAYVATVECIRPFRLPAMRSLSSVVAARLRFAACFSRYCHFLSGSLTERPCFVFSPFSFFLIVVSFSFLLFRLCLSHIRFPHGLASLGPEPGYAFCTSRMRFCTNYVFASSAPVLASFAR